MPRTARASRGGVVYHAINRGDDRATVFHKEADFQSFLDLMDDAWKRLAVPVLSCCLMPNHFHLVLWPQYDGGLSRWMQRLTTAHVRRPFGAEAWTLPTATNPGLKSSLRHAGGPRRRGTE